MPTALVCEDDRDILDLVSAALSGHGFDVRHAAEVAGALVAIGEEPLDVVVTDIALPDGSGVDVCRAAADAGARVVAMTATTGRELSAALEPCASVVLEKPFTLAALLEAVEF